MRIAKILGIIVIVIGVLITAVLVTISLIDINQYKGLIAEQVKQATGRELALEGDLALKVSLTPSVVVQSVRFANAPWGSQPDMVAMARLEAQVALIPLISGEIEIKRFILIEPDILLETDKEGQGNWEIAVKEEVLQGKLPAAQEQGMAFGVSVREMRIEDARVSYRDGVSGETMTLNFDRLSLRRKDNDRLDVEMDVSYKNVPFKLEGTTGLIHSLLQNKPFPLQLQVVGGDIDVALDGQIEQPMDAKGIAIAVSLNAKQLDKLSKLIDADLPPLKAIKLDARVSNVEQGYALADLAISVGDSDINGNAILSMVGERPLVNAQLTSNVLDLTVFEGGADKQAKQKENKDQKTPSSEPLSLEPLKSLDAELSLKVKELRSTAMKLNDIDMALKLADGKLDIEPLQLRFAGNSDLSAKVSLSSVAKRPFIKAELTSNMLDLSVFEGEAGQQTSKQEKKQNGNKPVNKDQRVFSADPLPLQSLRGVDADILFKSKKIRTTSLMLDNLDVTLKLKNGKLNIKPLRMNVAGGKVQADMVLDASSKTTAITANLNADQIELGKIDQIKALISGGKSKASIRLKGRGVSVRGIMAGLNGTLVTESGRGKINSAHINLLGSDFLVELINKINPLAKQGGTSDLECAVIRFDINNGVATTDKGIAFQTNSMMVVGAGTIDLKEEKLDLGIKPEARKGIGAGAGQLAELVRLTGTLSNPGIGADAKGVARLGATIGAAVATGGVSYLVQRGASAAMRDETPCLTALGKKPAKAAESTHSGSEAPKEEGSKVKGGVNKLLKGAQGFFGK